MGGREGSGVVLARPVGGRDLAGPARSCHVVAKDWAAAKNRWLGGTSAGVTDCRGLGVVGWDRFCCVGGGAGVWSIHRCHTDGVIWANASPMGTVSESWSCTQATSLRMIAGSCE